MTLTIGEQTTGERSPNLSPFMLIKRPMKQIEVKQKIEEFVKNNIDIHSSIFKDDYGHNVTSCEIKCPCKHSNLFAYLRLDENGKRTENSLQYTISCLAWSLLTHIEHKIRMRADKFHIELLIQLIGKDEALLFLDKWSKKNMIVALALQQYIQELRKVVV